MGFHLDSEVDCLACVKIQSRLINAKSLAIYLCIILITSFVSQVASFRVSDHSTRHRDSFIQRRERISSTHSNLLIQDKLRTLLSTRIGLYQLSNICRHLITKDISTSRRWVNHISANPVTGTPSLSGVVSSIGKSTKDGSIIPLVMDLTTFVMEECLEQSGQIKSGANIANFILRLKTLASRRLSLSEVEKQSVLNSSVQVMKYLDQEELSNCIWALGTLKCSVKVSSGTSAVTGIKTSSDSIQATSNSYPVVTAVNSAGKYSRPYSLKDKITSAVDVFSSSSEVHLPRVELFRFVSGLGKMGFAWEELPRSIRLRFLDMVFDDKKEVYVDPFDGIGGDGIKHGYSGAHRVPLPMTGREIAVFVYTLGQLGVTMEHLRDASVSAESEDLARTGTSTLKLLNGHKENDSRPVSDINSNSSDIIGEGLLPKILVAVLNRLSASLQVQDFTPQGLSNLFHGLAHIRVLWSDLTLYPGLQDNLLETLLILIDDMRPDEFVSLLQSLALMKVLQIALK